MSVDFSIVIPHRGNPLGFWATICSCEEELIGSSYKYNYVIVSNGEKLPEEAKVTIRNLGDKVKEHIHIDSPLTPPKARQVGVDAADGKILFFFDNHCLVGKTYFDRAMAHMHSGKMDMLHSASRFYNGITTYHYTLKLAYNFWGDGGRKPWNEFSPYKVAMSGHGGFVIPKTVWEEVGGYGPDSLLQGYGGEEPLFDLKMWRYGKNVWLDPKLIHYHYTGERGYPRHYTDDYYTNMLTVASCIGGEEWLYKIFNSLLSKSHIRPLNGNPKPWMELLEIATNRSSEYAKEIDSKSIRTLNDCLRMFREEGIAQ